MTLIQALISRSALLHNLAHIQNQVPKSPIWGVLKANAYGHGVSVILPELLNLVDGIACARLVEAREIEVLLKQSNAWLPILVLGGVYSESEYIEAFEKDYQCVIHSYDQVKTLEGIKESSRMAWRIKPVKVWLKINVGMNRLGIRPNDALDIFDRLNELTGVEIVGVMAHLGTADEPERHETKVQLRACVEIFRALKNKAPTIATSLSNSAHLLSQSFIDEQVYPWHGDANDWVRPGIALYGASPFLNRNTSELGLRPVMRLEARITEIRTLEVGESAGYGATWAAKKRCLFFVVACGYGDGYPRHIMDGVALWGATELTQAGRVSMDFTLFACDIDAFEEQESPKIGDYVQMWGQNLSVDRIAKLSQSIGYERLTQLNPLRVARRLTH